MGNCLLNKVETFYVLASVLVSTDIYSYVATEVDWSRVTICDHVQSLFEFSSEV